DVFGDQPGRRQRGGDDVLGGRRDAQGREVVGDGRRGARGVVGDVDRSFARGDRLGQYPGSPGNGGTPEIDDTVQIKQQRVIAVDQRPTVVFHAPSVPPATHKAERGAKRAHQTSPSPTCPGLARAPALPPGTGDGPGRASGGGLCGGGARTEGGEGYGDGYLSRRPRRVARTCFRAVT